MKNATKRGRSARNGNRPSPYAKYGKRPAVYSDQLAGLTRALTGQSATPVAEARAEHDRLLNRLGGLNG